MKKSFVAVAVLGAFAGSALAADVTLYGVIDLGLHYQNVNKSNAADVNKFDMAAGQNSGSRWGLKGTEDLGFGKVGFNLESGFDADTGVSGQSLTNKDATAKGTKPSKSTRLFGREAILYMDTDFGTLAFGRTGALSAGTGSYNLAKYTPFSTGWGSLTAQKANFWIGDRDRMDNTVTYRTPSFAGFQVTAQYSFNRAGQEEAGNERLNERYAALGASYNNGPLSTALVLDTVMPDHYHYTAPTDDVVGGKNQRDIDDSFGVTFGASYDFEVVKTFFQAQYAQHESKLGTATASVNKKEGMTGYAFSLGATAPVLGGTAYAQANYLSAEADKTAGDVKNEQQNWGVALGYTYSFSKRTMAYTYAGYTELKNKDSGDKEKDTEFGFGLVHKF